MGGLPLAFSKLGQLLPTAAIFVILYAIILATLRKARLFSGKSETLVAVCVSLLAVIGIIRTFGGAERSHESSEGGRLLDLLLLSYTAMAISMLLVLLLLILGKVVSRARETHGGTEGKFPDEHDKGDTSDEDSEDSKIVAGW